MSIPTPPSKQSFTKKTWGTNELIASTELNRIEQSLDDLFNNTVTLTGNKIFDDSLQAALIELSGTASIYHDGTNLVFRDDVGLPFAFTKNSGAPPDGILQCSGLINGINFANHHLRHTLHPWTQPPGEPWNRVYSDIPDPVARRACAIVGPPGSNADFEDINNAIDYVRNSNSPYTGGSVVFVKNGTYDYGTVHLYEGVDLVGESWGARIVGEIEVYTSPGEGQLQYHTIQGLRIDADGQPGISAGDSQRLIVRNNLFVSDGQWCGVKRYSGPNVAGDIVCNNIFLNGNSPIDLGPNNTTGIGRHLVANNILIDTNYGTVVAINISGVYCRVIRNILYVSSTENTGINVLPNYFSSSPDTGNCLIAHNYLYDFQNAIKLNSDKNFVHGNITHGYTPGIIDNGAGNQKTENIEV